MTLTMGDVDVVAAFSRNQRGRGLSGKTIRRRNVSLHQFARWIEPSDLFQAGGDDIEDWLITFRSATTRKAYRADLMAFYTWAVRRDLATTNPVLRTDPIKAPKGLPRPVPPALIPTVLLTAEHDVRIMCALAAMAGLRCSEIAALDRADIDLTSEPKTLAVRLGKGNKDRIVPLHPDLALILRGLPAGRVVHVNGQTVGVKIAAHLRSLGIDATAHQLRHTFGSELARMAVGNLVLVASLMGHESTETTKQYIGWAGGPAADAVKGMYPKAAA